MVLPKVDSKEPLYLHFLEPMDAFLAKETFTIIERTNNVPVKANFELLEKERLLRITPTKPWKAQNYELRVESRLEDLAGNNLNHLFDSETGLESDSEDVKKYHTLEFRLE